MKKYIPTTIRASILLILCTLLFACEGVSPRYYPLSGNETQLSPRPESEVEIFITKKPDYKYKELGMITYEIPSSFSDEPLIYKEMQKKAAQIGADAIIIMDPQSTIVNTSKLMLDYYGYPIETDNPRGFIKYRAMAISKIGK